MESLRLLQQQTVQNFLRARPIRTQLRQIRLQSQRSLYTSPTPSNAHPRSLSARIRTLRGYANSFRGASRRFASNTAETQPEQSLSLSQRLKKLSREYGWSAVGVYFLLSAADFPFCFIAVRLLGTDRIGHWEHVVVSKVKEWVRWPFSGEMQEVVDGALHEVTPAVKEKVPVENVSGHDEKRILEESETYVVVDHGYNEAIAANKASNASLWTQLALAYAIHKSFIFIRVPLTAAVTPKVVKTLRSWGWNIGKMPTKKIGNKKTSTAATGVNTKGSGVKSD